MGDVLNHDETETPVNPLHFLTGAQLERMLLKGPQINLLSNPGFAGLPFTCLPRTVKHPADASIMVIVLIHPRNGGRQDADAKLLKNMGVLEYQTRRSANPRTYFILDRQVLKKKIAQARWEVNFMFGLLADVHNGQTVGV